MKKLAALLLAVSISNLAVAQVKPEDQIKFRQSGYTFMSWNMGKIKAMVVDNPSSYNKEQVQAAANAIAGIANSGMGALFGPGTDKGKGWKDTRVKPEFFQKPDEVRPLGMALAKEATELQKVAATGDVNAIKAQFGKLGSACKDCHDKFRGD